MTTNPMTAEEAVERLKRERDRYEGDDPSAIALTLAINRLSEPSGELVEAVKRLTAAMDRAAHVESISAAARVTDLRTLLAAYAEMKEGLAVSQESGSRPHFANAYELVNHIGRMSHTGDEGYCWGDNDEDVAGRDTLDGLVGMARDIMSMSSTRALSSQTPAPVAESRETIKSLRSKLDLTVKALECIGDLDVVLASDWARMYPEQSARLEETADDSGDADFAKWASELARSTLTEMRKT